MYILGINAYHGDAAAALVRDGELIAAVEEERFNRVKHCAGFPVRSIEYCLRTAGISAGDLDHVGISRNPSANLHKKILFAARRLANGKEVRAKSKQAFAALETIGSISDAEIGVVSLPAIDAHANGNGNGFARQLASRLRNAARVRDVRNDLA